MKFRLPLQLHRSLPARDRGLRASSSCGERTRTYRRDEGLDPVTPSWPAAFTTTMLPERPVVL